MILSPARGAILICATVLLAGCSPAGVTGSGSSTPPATIAPDEVVEFASVQGSWKVAGGGQWASGEATICTTADPILIEDATAVGSADGVPVPSMVLIDGSVSYGTSWIGATTPTGPSGGSGAYLVGGTDGVPDRILGSAIVTWYDAESDTTSEREDTFEFELTPIETPAYCAS